ncbi:drug/metabolite transporter (DMT)-like permease [Trueperella bonasi]|uniref:Drug/metabolite transporter (DMT)-like permease n=1 Tax=Trueperella bonasi TaxID=312286 RepID=A0ABT9NFH1_9ACTO|nr:hypothetical protein [Trueperella bonasi]MDP9806134.1 drug/metabolite transporter (DMT)-like permease [Trueperella bonasi]
MTHHSLSDLERAEALPFTQASQFTIPEKLAFAVMMSALVAVQILMRAGQGIAAWALMFAALLVLATFASLVTRRRRTLPRISSAPREIKRAYRIYIVATAIAGFAALLGVPLLPQPWDWIGVGVTFVVMYGIISAFDTLYYRAVREVEARLSTPEARLGE